MRMTWYAFLVLVAVLATGAVVLRADDSGNTSNESRHLKLTGLFDILGINHNNPRPRRDANRAGNGKTTQATSSQARAAAPTAEARPAPQPTRAAPVELQTATDPAQAVPEEQPLNTRAERVSMLRIPTAAEPLPATAAAESVAPRKIPVAAEPWPATTPIEHVATQPPPVAADPLPVQKSTAPAESPLDKQAAKQAAEPQAGDDWPGFAQAVDDHPKPAAPPATPSDGKPAVAAASAKAEPRSEPKPATQSLVVRAAQPAAEAEPPRAVATAPRLVVKPVAPPADAQPAAMPQRLPAIQIAPTLVIKARDTNPVTTPEEKPAASPVEPAGDAVVVEDLPPVLGTQPPRERSLQRSALAVTRTPGLQQPESIRSWFPQRSVVRQHLASPIPGTLAAATEGPVRPERLADPSPLARPVSLEEPPSNTEVMASDAAAERPQAEHARPPRLILRSE